MMITINKIIFLSFITIGFMNCKECEKLNLTVEEKQWVSQFKVGQSFLFRNKIGQTDTLIVEDVSDKYTPCNKIELSKYQYEIYSVIFKFISANSYNGDKPSITMTTQEWQQRIPYIYLGNLGLHRNDLHNKKVNPIDTIVNGVVLKSVYYYANELNTENYGSREYFKNFFWSKEFGLMAYTTINDDIFLRSIE